MNEGALQRYRVLDLSDEKGYLCGKILGDLGADVIKIELPGGDPGRKIGPFYHNMPDPEKSLSWFAYNTSKRGLTLNIGACDGKQLFLQLAERADFVVESFPPGYLSTLGLGYNQLTKVNPRIILVSITPFGQEGPYRDFKTSDLVSMAMGGLVYITGEVDRPPVRITIPQAYLLAGVHAAAESLIAHYHREKTGEGQQVDISIQVAVARVLFMEPLFWDFDHYIIRRHGHKIWRANMVQTELWECKDGQVYFRIFGGAYGRRNIGLVEWMKEEGMAGVLAEVDWGSMDLTKLSQEESDEWERLISNFFRQHTKEELHHEALKRNITALAPCNTYEEIAEDKQLDARDYWVDVEYPHLGRKIRHPGAPCKMSLTPWTVNRRAPLIGEHNREIYCKELGLSQKEFELLIQGGVI